MINLRDENTGRIISFDPDSPTGTFYVNNENTGKLNNINLASPAGLISQVDADTGKLIEIDLSNPTGTINLIDANTGKIININLAAATGLFNIIDDDSGKIVQLDLSKNLILKDSGLIKAAATVKTDWYLPTGLNVSNVKFAYRAKGAASKAASLINLVNPGTNDLVEHGTLGWSAANGWSANGHYDWDLSDYVGQWLTNGYNWPATASTVLVKFKNYDYLTTDTNNDTSHGYLFGAGNGSSYGEFSPGRGDQFNNPTQLIWFAFNGFGQTLPYVATDVFNQGTIALSGDKFYLDGVVKASFDRAWQAASQSLEFHFFSSQFDWGLGTPEGCSTCNIEYIALYTPALTEAQIIEVTNNIK